jgi:hypothetical protein
MQDVTMNDMARALRGAGYSSSFERLIQIAQDAWARSPGKESALARHRYVQDKLSGELTYEMMRQWEREALRKSINYLLASTEPKGNTSVVGFLPTGGGQAIHDTQWAAAPAISSPDPAQAGGGGQGYRDTQKSAALANNDAPSSAARRSEPASQTPSPIALAPAAPSLSTLADKMIARTKANGLTMIRLSKLDEIQVLVDGEKKPLSRLPEVLRHARPEPLVSGSTHTQIELSDVQLEIVDTFCERMRKRTTPAFTGAFGRRLPRLQKASLLPSSPSMRAWSAARSIAGSSAILSNERHVRWLMANDPVAHA